MKRSWQFFSTVLGVIFRHPVTGTTIIPILPGGEVVLVRRRDTDQWSLPGGIVDWGEDIPTTVRRELAEETGLEVMEIERLSGVYSSPKRDPRLHSISVAIAVKVQGTLKVKDSLEISEAKAFSLNNIPSPLSHDHSQQLQDYLQGKTTIA